MSVVPPEPDVAEMDEACAVPWCDEYGPAGHRWEKNWSPEDGPAARSHVTDFGDADVAPVEVWVSACEDFGGALDPARLHIDGPFGDDALSAQQARALAGWLTAAAECLEVLQ